MKAKDLHSLSPLQLHEMLIELKTKYKKTLNELADLARKKSDIYDDIRLVEKKISDLNTRAQLERDRKLNGRT